MTDRTSVNGETAGRVAGDVRRDVDLAQFHREVGGIEVFIAAQHDRLGPVGVRLDHVERRQTFGMTRDAGQPRIDEQTMPVRRECMSCDHHHVLISDPGFALT